MISISFRNTSSGMLILAALALTGSTLQACETCSKGNGQAELIPPEYVAVLRELGKQGDYKSKVLKVGIPPSQDLKPAVDGDSVWIWRVAGFYAG